MKRIGLIVNPVAGLGGRVGLKGSDGQEIQLKALQLGAIPRAGERAAQALSMLASRLKDFELLTSPAEMGADSARQAGCVHQAVGTIQPGHTTAQDTLQAARGMLAEKVDLLLFAGGDGTARDICTALGMDVPVLGIPAGVKIHSAAYATSPRAAGDLAAAYLGGEAELRPAEVMDLDEREIHKGRISTRLFGYLNVPFMQRHIPGSKVPSPPGERAIYEAITQELRGRLNPGWITIVGPGTTTQYIANRLGFPKTMLGVAAALDGNMILADASEQGLLKLLAEQRQAQILLTPIGGQGCLLGRGNQPLSPQVIRRVGVQNILLVSTPEKIHKLNGRPLWVDSGDEQLDEMLSGYHRIITGYKESLVYKVTA